MKGSSQEFFDRESSRYEQFVKQRDFVLFLQGKVNPLLKGSVLDVGSGCVFDFDKRGFDLYVGLDLSLGMLLGLEREGKVKAICGDANHLPFQEGSFDTVIYRAVLHHLNPEGKALREMKEVVKRAFLEVDRILRRDGQILVIEPCLPAWLEIVEWILTPLIRWSMRRLGLPYVFLFSKKRLSDLLRKGGWPFVEIEPVRGGGRDWEWIMPVLGLPFIKIPRWAYPSTVHLFQGRR
jgi:SAM-dependent methyltransferase